ncbi:MULTISPECIES: YbaL family putative K(+) efflux transporter [Azospirillum]|uniref:YbaL family putative K(+) efflux transporter n=1 Tax=Azospirillum TaxID=191 RepID=UPI00157A897B|nr:MULTISPECIES: YbaL family putative K(+) efflux transporter [Azospirillum]MBB3268357.1 CPA2 family monovalent cation:H+ antiporter-2 [Azospirillum sp. OGB3]NUB31516.1 Kef family K(+) transporter [Azospirillum brasilense]UKJ78199.1 Kef family K(+) transporter [Azospirillum brasilense]
MPHETTFIATIVVGLVLAFLGGLLASKLRLPPLVGYLLAGVAAGPFTPGFVADEGLASQLAEIGVILLMFGVGLHFSIKDLLAVRAIAIPGALGQIVMATALGIGVAHIWGWPFGAGLVFGLALSVASTVVLLRALEERNILDSPNGRIAVGWLIVEDLAMVLALVLLPALAGVLGGTPRGAADEAGGGVLAATLALTLGKVAVFLALVLVVGTRAIPWLLMQVARTGSRELFTLSVLATALGIAFGSSELFGVSFALGAFFAGVVLSESDFSHQAAADALPLQDAFAVLFFVSVGMLFDPMILVHEPLAVLAVILVIVLGKTLVAFGIVMAFGYPASTALTVSASLAQVGEFSFILAGLGVTLGLLPPEGRDLILAGALLSITLNPLVFAGLDRLSGWLRRRPGMLGRLERQRNDRLSVLPPAHEGPRDHAVIVGYGRVGSVVGKGLKSQNLPIVVIDQSRRRVEALRKRGVPAVYGDATTPGVLEAAGTRRARLIVVATPQGYQTRRVLDLARRINPSIDTAVRTHSEAEVAHLERQGVGLAIMGERELAFGLMDYALRSFGSSDDKARAVVQGVRVAGEGGVYERRHGEPWREAPELRQHRDEAPPPD